MPSRDSARYQRLMNSFEKAKSSMIEKFWYVFNILPIISYENIKEIFPESLSIPTLEGCVLELAVNKATNMLTDKLSVFYLYFHVYRIFGTKFWRRTIYWMLFMC